MNSKGCLKWIAISSGIMLAVLAILYFSFNDKEPAGERGAEADVMANKMLKAINKEAWDSIPYVSWTFVNHDYVWDKKRHYVEVKWKKNRVLLNPNEISGIAFSDGKLMEKDEGDKMVKKAWSFFCNDSFWLNAPSKVFDPGTERSIVEIDGKKGLKISYTSGGVTPGDSYVWFIDDNGLPKSYKMWVKIIPVGGLEFSWEDWIEIGAGAKISTTHNNKGPALKLTNIKSGNSFEDFGFEADPFEDLLR